MNIVLSGLWNCEVNSSQKPPAEVDRQPNQKGADLFFEGIYGCRDQAHSEVCFSEFKVLGSGSWAQSLTLSWAKCEFGKAVFYLSRQVKRGHVSPVDAKMQAVVDFPD